ncbi:MAG: DNA-3-methyladenine glycosylase [Sandaracinaceae bacterium]
MLDAVFFARPVDAVAKDLVGKVLRRRVGPRWLSAAIVETEAYGTDRGSHAWLGRTPSREAMWAPPGTVYMYFSRGADSFNISAKGDGCAVLIKAARPFVDATSGHDALEVMHRLNPGRSKPRPDHRLLAGQTLLTRALDLRVREWNGRPFERDRFFVDDVGYRPESIVRCRRVGIPPGRDEHLMLRYVDEAHARSATRNPLRTRAWIEGQDYQRLPPGAPP